jgi:hypothetical protein
VVRGRASLTIANEVPQKADTPSKTASATQWPGYVLSECPRRELLFFFRGSIYQ